MDGMNLPNLELKNFPYFFLICLITVGLVSDLPATASGPAEFILGWDANEEADLDGYEIYVRKGTADTTYTFLAEVYLDELEDPDNPKVTISELYNGLLSDQITPVVRMAELTNNSTYHFALTAFDTQGNTSDFSEELCVEVIGTKVFECGSTDNSNGDSDSSMTVTAAILSTVVIAAAMIVVPPQRIALMVVVAAGALSPPHLSNLVRQMCCGTYFITAVNPLVATLGKE